METINGEWYMKGCGPADPNRLHTPAEAAALIRQIGFLPLFSNDLPGFSLEERTLARDWWTGDPGRDPWEWRQQLSRLPEIVYGKFFDRKAGFVSTDWFPRFANCRRDGYDFDTLIDEGRAPHRAQKLMQPFLTDGLPNDTALLSNALKALAGFGKGGEKNYEGVLTDLEMQTYLIISDFRQRTNRRGEPYGWHLAVIRTPEGKLGCGAVTAAYAEPPRDALRHMIGHLRGFLPEASEERLRRLLRPGRP